MKNKHDRSRGTAIILSLTVMYTLLLWPRLAAVAADSEVSSAPGTGLDEIVVTAEKRSQGINEVPATITAVSGNELRELGVTSPLDVPKIVPSLNVSRSAWGVPVYTLRGIGFYDNSLGAVPAVTVYVDEVPLTYSQTTEFALLDVERIEVLKGPQGTLYGQNSTGGAINFIAAKPTKTLQAGADVTFGRFNDTIVDGFISGPITDTLSVRLSGDHEGADGWQHSLTRPDDTLGHKNISYGRILLAWDPRADLSVLINANAGLDKSDTQAPQFQEINPVNAVAYNTDKAAHPGLFNTPRTPNNAQAADWDPGVPFRKNNTMYQVAATIKYTVANSLDVLSITSFDRFNSDSRVDADGTPFEDVQVHDVGDFSTVYQEFRVEGAGPSLKWLVGANYERDHVNEDESAKIPDSFLGAFGSTANSSLSYLENTSKSGYGSLDYSLTDKFALSGGVRYTDQHHTYTGCTVADDAITSAFFTILDGAPVPIGACLTLKPDGKPGIYSQAADENNASWRFGATYKPVSDSLIYATVSKGFKAGSFPNIAASEYLQESFVRQEELTDVELGVKQAMLERRLQLNVAAFYYIYKDKQVLGNLIDPATGASFPALVNVPKSNVKGGEFQAIWQPIDGFKIDLEGTYADSRISDVFVNIDFLGAAKNFQGESLPFSPRWSGVARVDYEHAVTDRWNAFVGVSGHYQSATNSALGAEPLAAVAGYGTLDLRVGISSRDDKYRLALWGNNVTNKYYWTNVFMPLDAVARYAGLPVTYGITASYRY